MWMGIWSAFVQFINSDEYGAIWGYPAQLFIPVAVILGVYGVLLLGLIRHVVRPTPERKITLLLGAHGAGKTTIFHQFRDGELVETTPTTEEYGAKFPMSTEFNTINAKRFVKIFDFPGHPRLRSRVTSHYATAGIIAFIVDAADASSFRRAAQFLLDMFSNDTFQQVAPTTVIVCNKADLPSAASIDVVRHELEKELTLLKDKPQAKTSATVGRENTPFEFGVDAPCQVSFVRCSAKDGDLKDLSTFILQNY